MSNSATTIQLESVGKRYWLRHRQPDRRLLEVLHDAGRSAVDLMTGRLQRQMKTREEFWALRNVSLEIQAGEVVGLIGRNGAGKSTLLKLISSIMAPTEGRVGIRGRLGCLLEVGSGFHPELTGRENVFLNGAILGMSLQEIRRKFDEIVAFSEVEAFLDMPVKHYSSGMFVRLAFAVAASLRPEILIVDEVLAVGDSAFQQKCLKAIRQAVSAGCTCLLVSHHLPSIASLCQRVLLLEKGHLTADGEPEEVIRRYVDSTQLSSGQQIWEDDSSAPGNDEIRIRAVKLWQNHPEQTTSDIELGADVHIDAICDIQQAISGVTVTLQLRDASGGVVLMSSTAERQMLEQGPEAVTLKTGRWLARCRIPAHLLNEGRYAVTIIVGRGVAHPIASAFDAISFQTHDVGELRALYAGTWPGVIRPRLDWTFDIAPV